MTRSGTSAAIALSFCRRRRIRARRSRVSIDDLPAPPLPTKQPRHELLPIAREQIEQLRADALSRGDPFFARVCERALRGNPDAINACKAAVYGLA